MKGSVTLCGCGWLGNYLLRELSGDFQILGTTRSKDRAEHIRKNGGQVLFYSLSDSSGAVCELSKDATVVLNIPPGKRNQDLLAYTRHMCDLVDNFLEHQVRQIIFISTTSVYGEEERIVKESAELMPQTESAKAHCVIETHLTQQAGDKASIVRLAGLVGPDRHPIASLAGRQLSQANKVVNLVHVNDVVTALRKLIENGASKQLLHLCSLTHPARKEYYIHCAEKLELPVPSFDKEDAVFKGKQIDATASWQYLGMTPRYASPFEML